MEAEATEQMTPPMISGSSPVRFQSAGKEWEKCKMCRFIDREEGQVLIGGQWAPGAYHGSICWLSEASIDEQVDGKQVSPERFASNESLIIGGLPMHKRKPLDDHQKQPVSYLTFWLSSIERARPSQCHGDGSRGQHQIYLMSISRLKGWRHSCWVGDLKVNLSRPPPADWQNERISESLKCLPASNFRLRRPPESIGMFVVQVNNHYNEWWTLVEHSGEIVGLQGRQIVYQTHLEWLGKIGRRNRAGYSRDLTVLQPARGAARAVTNERPHLTC